MSADDVVIGIDLAEFDALLDGVKAEASVTMDVLAGVEEESDIVELRARQIEQASREANRRILSNLRRTAMVVRGFAMASGDAFNEVITLGIEAAIMTAELVFTIATAESLTVALAFQAAAKFAMVTALILRANQLRQARTEQAMRTQGIITMLTVFTY